MKNPDLFKHGKEFIDSMEELIKRYQAAQKLGISKNDYERRNNMSCLLCNPLGLDENHHSIYIGIRHECMAHTKSCTILGCPWIVILGMTCDDFANIKHIPYIYHTTHPSGINRRIKQIRNWIKIYKKYMEEIK